MSQTHALMNLTIEVNWVLFVSLNLCKLIDTESGTILAQFKISCPRIPSDASLSEAAAYARNKKVALKGDLPIGVDRNSVDTWVYPNLFRMNTSTGAPPDYFDKNGQNWGFPTYNWEEMSKDNYAWWRARLTQDNFGDFWTVIASNFLNEYQRHCYEVMQELGLIGLRIQRMPSEPGLEFGIPSQYSYMTGWPPSYGSPILFAITSRLNFLPSNLLELVEHIISRSVGQNKPS
ncbi:hypothetical protein MRB53_009854 [Persea americana]|uniref:Uncharacterized protein n=1 Tax=Persea americana TaxID=3435 RepID=A0ACC2LQB6_PERAE|nr:hypothetical protein MRB53_009854 [Persea americana]